LSAVLASAQLVPPAPSAYDTTSRDRYVVDIVMRSPAQPTQQEVHDWLNDNVLSDPQHADLLVPLENITVAPL
jgi:hypothetical protein